MQKSPGFINLQLYREISKDPEKITYMQIENWEDEESLENDLSSAHVLDFWNTTAHTFEFEIKRYSSDQQEHARFEKPFELDVCKEEYFEHFCKKYFEHC